MKQLFKLPADKKIDPILSILDRFYGDATCSLNYSSPLQLMVATILSAQCTDERVNQVTATLFAKYPTVQSFAEAELEELQKDIKSAGFFRNKAKNIRDCCRILHERFDSQVPADLSTLVQLPGIGRKTANVILGNAFNIPGLVVDTHVGRVSQRLGLTTHRDPAKIERDLMRLLPAERWTRFSHQLIQHGRKICFARKPNCMECPLREFSIYAQKSESNQK
jgi:endonuclease III